MEVFNIDGNDLEPVTINFSNDNNQNSQQTSNSVNFGPGIELLMNDKKRSASNDMNVDLGNLDDLEQELNDLSNKSEIPSINNKPDDGFASKVLNFGGFFKDEPIKIHTTSPETINHEQNDSNLGRNTRESAGNSHTWDGYSKMNEMPNISSSSTNMNDREKRRKKRMMIKKMEDWYDKGHIKHNSHFTIDSSYEEIEDEYETIMEDKRKKDSVKLQGWWFMTFVNSIEYANAAFNPFDLNLDGWGEQINEDIDSYEDIFSELHDKYKGGKMAPELSLCLRLGFSAAVLNFSNKALSTATPAFNDVIKQSPELMKMFTNATVNNMSQQSPGFEFANNLMQEQSNMPRGPPPPASVETKTQPPPQRPGMIYTQTPNNRPDINAGRGVELNNYQNVNQQETPIYKNPQQSQAPRAEMKGPQNVDIDNILSGLKTRTVNIQPDDDSLISVSSLKDMDNTMPKRTNRKKNRSDKNSITLDI
jgi:hypothetical protein